MTAIKEVTKKYDSGFKDDFEYYSNGEGDPDNMTFLLRMTWVYNSNCRGDQRNMTVGFRMTVEYHGSGWVTWRI